MKKAKLLYVDDEPINLQLFEYNFEGNYEVLTGESGSEGLDILDKNHDVQIVISDMKMPGMNGIEFIKKAKNAFNNIAYFILTGFDITEEIKDALEKKLILAYFSKPFNPTLIERSIEDVLKK